MRRNIFLIANPGAGLSGYPLVNQVLDLLKRAGASVSYTQPHDVHAARRAASEAASLNRYDAIVAAGGDGTIRQVAAAVLGTRTPLGIIPVGTGNVLAHEIGLVREGNAVANMLLHGPEAPVMCARANGEPFLLMAGAGFDARVIGALDHRFKSFVGKAAYAGPVLGALVQPVDTLSITVDGHGHEASWAVISNARHYGGRFVLAPRTGIRERGLQAVLFKARNRAVLAGQILSLVFGKLDRHVGDDIQMLSCASVTITSHRPVPTQIDGDTFGQTPLVVDSGSAELQLIMPAPLAGNSRQSMHS